MNTYDKGIISEYIAALYLTFKGYRIIKMRYKTPVGEIDIIAKKGAAIICVEVKYRKTIDSGLYAISRPSQKRIMNAANMYLSRNGRTQSTQIRFDALILSPPFSVKHIVNAWTST